MLAYPDLDDETRRSMLAELDSDLNAGTLHLSNRLTSDGRTRYPQMLRDAFAAGDDESLANALAAPGVLELYETSSRKGRTFSKRVPHNAARSLAEGEFNRFYIRALCVNVLAFGGDLLMIDRAKTVSSPRPRSEALVGTFVPAAPLLIDLRERFGIETALGVPGGPNSGLSVRYPT